MRNAKTINNYLKWNEERLKKKKLKTKIKYAEKEKVTDRKNKTKEEEVIHDSRERTKRKIVCKK
jgi:hypothetical protein